uniref:ORF7a protein n=1 Tax=Bat Coronavirus RlYN17 TaxID=3018893 RepID=A0AA49EE73_9NIDO|nr:ORF7a protein [Bat Coronavirus RlYN17]
MFKLLLAVTLLASGSCFKLQLNAQSYCVSSDLEYCFGLVEPCTGVLVALQQPRNLTVYMCVTLTGVSQREVGTQHVFTLLDPFGRFICNHKVVNETFSTIGWGSRRVVLAIMAKGFNVLPTHTPTICNGGAVLKVPGVSNVVYACLSLQDWPWEYIFRSYSLEPAQQCNLVVRPLTKLPKHYYPKQSGVFARPIRDEL